MKNLVLSFVLALSIFALSNFGFANSVVFNTNSTSEVFKTDESVEIVVIDGVIYKITISEEGIRTIEVIGSVHD